MGSPASPLKTINAAVATSGTLVGVHKIHVGEGSYNEGVGGVALVDGIQISGGYAADWTQTGGATTIVAVRESVFADGDTGVSLDHLTLAPTAPGNPGSSVYGLRAISSSTVALSNVAITTPAGIAGPQGSTGANGFSGQPGQGGQGAVDDCANPAGLGGAGGALFNAGGKGGDTNCSRRCARRFRIRRRWWKPGRSRRLLQRLRRRLRRSRFHRKFR